MEAIIWNNFSVTFKDVEGKISTSLPFKNRMDAVGYCEELTKGKLQFIDGCGSYSYGNTDR